MRQSQFTARHQDEWNALSAWLDSRGQRWRKQPPALLADADFPAAYRRLCQQFALAEQRGYSASLLARLQDLVQRGHTVLYRPPPPRWQRSLQFVSRDLPRLVRAESNYVYLSAVLFFVPLLLLVIALQYRPELAHSLFDAEQLAQYENMYDPNAERHALGRESGSDLEMFGFYVMNNISIGFRSFASGLIGALGPIFMLLLNGVVIGGIAGHLTAVGHGEPFWRFVSGHAAPELLALVIAGAAGLKLGMALLAPGRRSRARALIEDGLIGAKLVLMVFVMLLFAAFVEAYWSSIGWMPSWIKFSVGGTLWVLILLWWWRGGRGAGDAG